MGCGLVFALVGCWFDLVVCGCMVCLVDWFTVGYCFGLLCIVGCCNGCLRALFGCGVVLFGVCLLWLVLVVLG